MINNVKKTERVVLDKSLKVSSLPLEAIKCPHCNKVKQVKRHGTAKKGTAKFT